MGVHMILFASCPDSAEGVFGFLLLLKRGVGTRRPDFFKGTLRTPLLTSFRLSLSFFYDFFSDEYWLSTEKCPEAGTYKSSLMLGLTSVTDFSVCGWMDGWIARLKINTQMLSIRTGGHQNIFQAVINRGRKSIRVYWGISLLFFVP